MLRDRETEIDAEERARTIQQQIQLLMNQSGNDEIVQSSVLPKADSVQAVVIQALQSDDKATLEKCLAITDPVIITNTVRRLPTSYVVRFLKQLIDLYQRQGHNKGLAMVIWVRTILAHHTSYLVTVPDLVQILSGLYLSIDSRLTIFKKMLKLSGRLDLLLSQIATQSIQSSGSATIYEEEDEEIEVDANGNLESKEDQVEEDEDNDEKKTKIKRRK